MANNILTQDEVDALLNAVDQGELFTEDDAGAAHTPEGHTVSNYSFRRPHLITREQLRGVTNLHDDFAREFQSSLSISLQTAVDIRRVSAEQQQYNEFVFSLSDVTHITLFSMDPLPGKGVLELNLSLVFGIVDLFLGGEGDVESAIRKPTEVELAIIEPVVGRLFACLAEAIGLVLPVDIQPERVESSPEYVQAAPLDAPVVVLAFDVRIGLANGIINLCYPVPMVQSLLRELQGRTGQLDNYYGKVRPVDSRRQMLAALLDIPVRATAFLGQAWLRPRDWLSLAPGDVIVLDREVGEPVNLEIEGIPAFQCLPGTARRTLGVKVLKRFEASGRGRLGQLVPGHEADNAEQQ